MEELIAGIVVQAVGCVTAYGTARQAARTRPLEWPHVFAAAFALGISWLLMTFGDTGMNLIGVLAVSAFGIAITIGIAHGKRDIYRRERPAPSTFRH